VFVHDYFQLVFDDECFNVYNRARLVVERRHFYQREHGFADRLVELIGSRVVSCEVDPALVLIFDRGVRFEVLMTPEDASGPEAFEYCAGGASLMVGGNAA